ncbi:MAG: isochorismatase family cysteine hydrolase [Erysipelotrichaceae bacterium]|nr:isochorismatase family cysteine hydrolase [Erysipelotrichaceae bacterium]
MKHVLIAVDLQNDFVSMALGTKEAVEIIPAAVKEIEDPYYDTVIATFDTHTEDYLNTFEGKHLPVVHCVKGTEGWLLEEHIEQAVAKRNGLRIEKPTFGSVELLDLLMKEQPESITLIGLCTDICVVSNAMLVRAGLHETPIRVVAAACAGTTPENHDHALAVMKSCQIEIL